MTAQREYLVNLRELLTAHFSESELRTLCFDLDVEYEDLRGTGRSDKERELVAYLARHDRMGELTEVGARLRPDIPWRDPGDIPTHAGTGEAEANARVEQRGKSNIHIERATGIAMGDGTRVCYRQE